jgi:peptidoglycan/LPS O-acetylase OafA/YrhL
MQAGQMILFTFPVRLGLICVFYLLTGSAIALLAPNAKLLASCAPLFIVIWLIALFGHDRRVYDVTEMVLFPLTIIGIGVAQKIVIPVPKMLGDISYGIYIYHFAVAELIRSWKIDALQNGYLIALSTVLSMLVAWISFHVVEKRALSMKRTKSRSTAGNAFITDQASIVRDDAHKPV